MKKFFLSLLGLMFLPIGVSANDSYLQDELEKIKEDMKIIQRQIYHDKNDTVAPQESVTNFQMRLGEYDQMIRDMNGKVESFDHRISSIEKKLEMIDKDIELRFEQMKRHSNITPQNNTNDNKTKPLAKAPKGIKAKDLYEAGLNDLKAGKLSEAETKFSQFLGSFPKDELAGNAQYWLGEVYYKQQNFTKSAIAFKEGYNKYPNGTKGPDCLLKLGLSMKALNKNEEACTAFVNIPTIFGNVNKEISDRAKKEAESLACK